jgi:hypothetical protein
MLHVVLKLKGEKLHLQAWEVICNVMTLMMDAEVRKRESPVANKKAQFPNNQSNRRVSCCSEGN